MSLDTIAAEIRDHFGLGNWWRISSAIQSDGDQITLSVSLDGVKEHKKIVIRKKLNQIDDMFSEAAEKIFTVTDPYVVVVAYTKKDPAKSNALAQQIILLYPATDPIVAWAHIHLSYLTKDEAEAQKEAEAAILVNRKIATAHLNLGSSFFNQGKYKEALEEYRESIWLNSREKEAYGNLGILLKRQGQQRLAIDQYNRAIEIDPDYSDAHSNLGNILQDQGEQERAILEYKKAIASNPKNAVAHVNLGHVVGHRGKVDEAIQEYREAIESDPRYAWAHYSLADALTSRGELNLAVEEFDEAVSIEPENQFYLNAQKEALAERDRQEALAVQASDDPPAMPPVPP